MDDVKRFTSSEILRGNASGLWVHVEEFERKEFELDGARNMLDAQRLRADTAEAELHHLREQLSERDATIENLNDRHDLGVQERDRLRSQLSAEKALRLDNQRIVPARFKCLACGDYHEGSGSLPCPKMSPYAALNPKPEAGSHADDL